MSQEYDCRSRHCCGASACSSSLVSLLITALAWWWVVIGAGTGMSVLFHDHMAVPAARTPLR